MWIYWVFLVLSVLFEVAGTSIMKAGLESHPAVGMAVMYLLVGVSYYTLSKAVQKLPVGVAYAFWEAAGLALITFISIVILGEHVSTQKIIAILMLMLGTYLVNKGTSHADEGAGK